MEKRKLGLFFGSFNPIHNGHLMVAKYALENKELDSVFFIVSPQNPFKSNGSKFINLVKLSMELL